MTDDEEQARAAGARYVADLLMRPILRRFFLRELGGVLAGVLPPEKRPYSTRPAERGEAPWDVHQEEGYLLRGIDAWEVGDLDDACLVPGSIRTRGAWLACADVDDVSLVDADDPSEGTWADRAAHALELACAPVLVYAKPDGSGKRHVWVLAGEPVGNGDLFVQGRKVGGWRGRGGTVGGGVCLYPGEGKALMEALQAGNEDAGEAL